VDGCGVSEPVEGSGVSCVAGVPVFWGGEGFWGWGGSAGHFWLAGSWESCDRGRMNEGWKYCGSKSVFGGVVGLGEAL